MNIVCIGGGPAGLMAAEVLSQAGIKVDLYDGMPSVGRKFLLAGVGGMNHFMLPDGDATDVSGRYGSYAMELLINEMLKLGARRETMQAKIFGGAQVMHNFTTMNVGERNTQFVVSYLRTERIPIVSEDVLDIYPRKVVFFPATGKAMVKRLAHAHPDVLAQEKRGSAATVVQTTAGGSVDLF